MTLAALLCAGIACAADATTYVRYSVNVSTRVNSVRSDEQGRFSYSSYQLDTTYLFTTTTDALATGSVYLTPSQGAYNTGRISTSDGFHLAYTEPGYVSVSADFPAAAYTDASTNLSGGSNVGGVYYTPSEGHGYSTSYSNTIFRSFSTQFSQTPFATSTNSVAAQSTSYVPEPASWMLMIAGFGMLATTLRFARRLPPEPTISG